MFMYLLHTFRALNFNNASLYVYYICNENIYECFAYIFCALIFNSSRNFNEARMCVCVTNICNIIENVSTEKYESLHVYYM